MAIKDNIPNKFKGCFLVMALIDFHEYEAGDVVDILEVDWSDLSKEEMDEKLAQGIPLGMKVWENAKGRYDIRYIENVTYAELQVMKEPLMDGLVPVLGVRRKYQYKVEDAKFKTGEVVKEKLDKADVTSGTITERELDAQKNVIKKDKVV